MTFNIRYYLAPNDGLDAWEYRRKMVAETMGGFGADVIGLQEATIPQVEYLRGKLEEDFGILATYTDGKRSSSSNALFYRKNRLRVEDWGTFWYSDTPETPGSKGWGNEIPRFCTWAYFVEIKTGRGFYFYNTHFDHRSHRSREKSALLLTSRIDQRQHSAPFVLVGDLNAEESGRSIRFLKGSELLLDEQPYRTPVPVVDTFRVKHGDEAFAGTFNGFNKDSEFKKIDYVFTEKCMEILDAEVVTRSKDGRYPSDHFPVTATIRFQ